MTNGTTKNGQTNKGQAIEIWGTATFEGGIRQTHFLNLIVPYFDPSPSLLF